MQKTLRFALITLLAALVIAGCRRQTPPPPPPIPAPAATPTPAASPSQQVPGPSPTIDPALLDDGLDEALKELEAIE